MEASRSRTRPGTATPAAVEPGSCVPVSAACAQASSLAWARASRSRDNTAPSTLDSSHHAEQVRLVTQDSEVSDRLPTVGEHHRQVHRDPSWVMTATPHPQRAERVAERTGQPRGVGEVSQQPRASVPDDTPTISGGNDLRTTPGNLHLESALRGEMEKDPQQVLSSQPRGHFHVPDPPPAATLNEGARLGTQRRCVTHPRVRREARCQLRQCPPSRRRRQRTRTGYRPPWVLWLTRPEWSHSCWPA